MAVGCERKDVRQQRRRGERNREPVPSAPGQSASQREEDGQERKDEKTEVAHVERCVRRGLQKAEAEELGDLERHSRGDRQPHGHDGIARLGRRRGLDHGRAHELLPETLGVFHCEFARQSILIAQALDGHQERFVLVQARPAQHVDLAAQVVLEFLDVGGMDRLPSPEILPPLPDAFFQDRLVRHGITPLEGGQTGWAAGSTAMRRMPLIA